MVTKLFICEKNYSCCNYQYWDKWEDVEQDSKECGHLVEVVPVKHARWEKHNGDEYHMYCSNCGNPSATITNYTWYSFCPVCGAKMDLEG